MSHFLGLTFSYQPPKPRGRIVGVAVMECAEHRRVVLRLKDGSHVDLSVTDLVLVPAPALPAAEA